MGRGLERRELFTEDREREHFLDLLAAVHETHGLVIHAYVLMDITLPSGGADAGMVDDRSDLGTVRRGGTGPAEELPFLRASPAGRRRRGGYTGAAARRG